MAHPLLGAYTKVERARTHTDTLHREIREFLDRHPHPAELQVDEDEHDFPEISPTGLATRVIVRVAGTVVARVTEPPPVIQWGIVVGDVVNNLRAALDYLVWELSVLHTGGPPPATANSRQRGVWRKIGFPTVLRERDWNGACTEKLAVIDSRLYRRFEELQPYYAAKHRGADPDRHPLTMLNELWNRDKHRAVTLISVGTLIQSVKLASETTDPLANQLQLTVIEGGDWRPYEDGSVLGRMEISNPTRTSQIQRVELLVDLQGAVEVTFENGSPAFGGRVRPTLYVLIEHVEQILRAFEPEFM